MELLYGALLHRWPLRTAPLEPTHVDRLLDHAFRGISGAPPA